MTYIIDKFCITILGVKPEKYVFKPESLIEKLAGNMRVSGNRKI